MNSKKNTMKRLATSDDVNITVTPPFSIEVLNKRDNDYLNHSDTRFCKE